MRMVEHIALIWLFACAVFFIWRTYVGKERK